MKNLLLAISLSAVASLAHADDPPPSQAGLAAVMPELLGGENFNYTPEELKDLSALTTDRPTFGRGQDKPIILPNGTVVYTFGIHHIRAICAVFQPCTIALEPGETLRKTYVTDPRWQTFDAIEGRAPSERYVVFFKPLINGIKSQASIVTDRRTYNIEVQSDTQKHIPRIEFLYADNFLQGSEPEQYAELKAAASQQPPPSAPVPDSGTSKDPERRPRSEANPVVPDLVFDYACDGRAPFRPVRIYNDGKRTYIELPRSLPELPTLMEVRTPGDVFNGAEERSVATYWDERRRRLMVNGVFDAAMLVSGVGRNQLKVVCRRLPPGGE